MKSLAFRVALPIGVLGVLAQTYRRQRRRQLVLMPKGINDAAGVTMRSAIKAARPIAHSH